VTLNATPNALTGRIIDAAYRVHTILGPGLLINFNAYLIKDGITRVIND
jgi:hypothetical protein